MEAPNKKIRVLLMIDTGIKRSLTANGLVRQPDITICGMVEDADSAIHHIIQNRPDVIVLDSDTPGLNVNDFLCHVIAQFAMPVILMSPEREHHKTVIDALSIGAISVVSYNRTTLLKEYKSLIEELCVEIRCAAAAKISRRSQPPCESLENEKDRSIEAASRACHASQIIVIGSSAGGVDALSRMLPLFPSGSPGIVIVQHMPAGFTQRFAERLDTLCAMQVKEAEEGDCIQPDRVLLAPGSNYHTVIQASEDKSSFKIHLSDEEKVSNHRPSVDVLFHSAVYAIVSQTAAVLLTGMGSDGAKGMLAIHNAGGLTFAQDEASCVVFGMPGVAYKMGAVQKLLPLEQIPRQVILALNERATLAVKHSESRPPA